ncbi:MAG TPA: HAMP domain-containing sensor histidine kinase [Longimicrobiales bacterium]|nr:HAMP domain-containing sensor histidine kinase [Longimicrobiales bacterium]
MSLRFRFLLSLLAVLVIMAAPALFAASRVTALRDVVLDLRGQAAQSALAVGRLQAALAQVDRYQRAYVVTTDPELAERMRGSVREAATEIRTLRAAGYGDLVDAAGLHPDRLEQSSAHIEALVGRGQLDAATAYLGTIASPLVEGARAALPALAGAIDANTSASGPAARKAAAAAATATLIALLVALALAGALALTTVRVITRPLDRLRFAMARVAEGTFEAPAELPYDEPGEVGELSRSFLTMTMRLAELDRLKADFVGSASQDLKAPISVICGYAELMQDELGASLTGRHRELLRSLREQTQSLQRRLEQLLEVSRMESGRLRLGLEEINLRHFAAELQRAFEPAARMRDLRLELVLHDHAPAFMIADPDVLRTDILGNLVSNALKFTPAGGLIRISIRPDGERLHFEVADTGCGIAEDQLAHIFEKYYQGRGAPGGAGLGLAIAKAAVEAHGGRIDVQSRVGQGSRFRVGIPVRAATGGFAVRAAVPA